MRPIIVSVVMILAAASVNLAGTSPLVEREWQVDGVKRKALVHVPAAARQTETPVVFAFHGHGGNMNQAARGFAYHVQWPEALVVYMQGLNTPGKLTDPEGKKPGWQHSLGDQKDRDLKFFDAVLASLKTDFKVDEKRIYSTGHSNGGGFTYLLWANRGTVFAAVAPSGAAPNLGANLTPLPALHVAGENDALVKFVWQKRAMDLVRKVNGCDTESTPWSNAGPIVGTLYPSKTGTPFVAAIYPGTHAFPKEAPGLITKFFKEHSKK